MKENKDLVFNFNNGSLIKMMWNRFSSFAMISGKQQFLIFMQNKSKTLQKNIRVIKINVF